MGYIWNINGILLAGWWLSRTPLKIDGVKVSWDDDILNINGNIKLMFQTTNQMTITRKWMFFFIGRSTDFFWIFHLRLDFPPENTIPYMTCL